MPDIEKVQIAPFAGVIPPEPGLAVATGETYFDGSIGGGRTVPIAGLLVANVDMKAAFTPIALFYIWPTPTKEWNFASAVSFPLAWLEVEANLSLGPFYGPEKREHLRIVRSGFYSDHSKPSFQRD